MYGTGNYRLSGKFRNFLVNSDVWRRLDETHKQQRFLAFLRSKRNSTETDKYIKSSYSDFSVPASKVAKKPGQKTRIRSTKTKNMAKAKLLDRKVTFRE